MSELWQLTGTDVSALVRSKQASAVDVCNAVLARLEAVNGRINAVVQRTDDEARRTAANIDEAIARGEDPGPMAGVPVTIKVNVDQAGYATTNGLRLQKDLVAEIDNPVVANLKKTGAVIVGRTNTPAFSLRWFTRNGVHGHTRNPHSSAITPGGSSGGAGSATAAGIGAIGHGSDIGGSVRYPAYACGIQGLRPTLGRIPAVNFTGPDRHVGAQLMAVSGPLARSIADVRLAFAAMSQRDPRDPWWTPAPHDQIDVPKRAGWEVTETESPPFREPARLQAQLWLSEFRRTGAAAVAQEADPDASFVYEQMVRLCPAPDLNDFMDAMQRRMALLREWNLFLEQYPVLICPVSAEVPFPDLDDVSSPEAFERIMEAQLTQVDLPLMGLPGLSVFTGMAGAAPCGAQLVGGRYMEDVLLKAGADIEARSPKILPVDPAGD